MKFWSISGVDIRLPAGCIPQRPEGTVVTKSLSYTSCARRCISSRAYANVADPARGQDVITYHCKGLNNNVRGSSFRGAQSGWMDVRKRVCGEDRARARMGGGERCADMRREHARAVRKEENTSPESERTKTIAEGDGLWLYQGMALGDMSIRVQQRCDVGAWSLERQVDSWSSSTITASVRLCGGKMNQVAATLTPYFDELEVTSEHLPMRG
ncbi:uncharacterized protein ARMOST_04261 [Armillaria ostoyae]|uniref:Uncharacterized protein n=1 Tax=Armillaria ostoyae TaxID=47428 RepID=A0A284QWV3_ARMOS|nr:uncharacterized protein ARMOST_04261 [Armillaria ostoyae]